MCERLRPSRPEKEVANDDRTQKGANKGRSIGVEVQIFEYWTTTKSREISGNIIASKHYKGYKVGKDTSTIEEVYNTRLWPERKWEHASEVAYAISGLGKIGVGLFGLWRSSLRQ